MLSVIDTVDIVAYLVDKSLCNDDSKSIMCWEQKLDNFGFIVLFKILFL